MGSDRDIADGEEIVLRVVVGIGVYFTCSNKNERGIDVYGEFDVAILVSVYLELSFLFGGLVEGFVLLLFILHFFLDGLVHPTAITPLNLNSASITVNKRLLQSLSNPERPTVHTVHEYLSSLVDPNSLRD